MPLRNKLTEEETNELFNNILIKIDLNKNSFIDFEDTRKETINSWKKKDFIEESSLDKARKYFGFVLGRCLDNSSIEVHLRLLIAYYEEAIKELQDKIK